MTDEYKCDKCHSCKTEQPTECNGKTMEQAMIDQIKLDLIEQVKMQAKILSVEEQMCEGETQFERALMIVENKIRGH